MVLLFSNRKIKLEKEIIEILTACGGDFISDKAAVNTGGFFTIAAFYKNVKLNIKRGVALVLDDTDKFEKLTLPNNIIGICEDNNINALKIFKKNGLPVITCGSNPKNTITFSSIDGNNYIVTLQREIVDINGKTLYPTEYKIELKKKYSTQAVLLSCCVLCLMSANFNP